MALTLADRGGAVLWTVHDDGPGILPDDLPHIFERFYTGNHSRTRNGGLEAAGQNDDHLGQSSGLGLAIAAKIVAGHGGTLTVASEPGQGCTFAFELPAAGAFEAARG